MKTWHVPCNSLAGAHQYLYWCVYLYSAMPGACPKGVATPEGRFSSDYYITVDRAFAYLPTRLDGRNHLHSNNTAIHITFSGLLARNSGLVVLNIQAAYSGFLFLKFCVAFSWLDKRSEYNPLLHQQTHSLDQAE